MKALKDDEFGLYVLSIKNHKATCAMCRILPEKEKPERSDGLGR